LQNLKQTKLQKKLWQNSVGINFIKTKTATDSVAVFV
jgi:hypothetical protein